MLRVNFLAPAFLTLAALPAMLRRGEGWIVNVSSAAGKLPPPRESAYAASKFALTGFTEGLWLDLAGPASTPPSSTSARSTPRSGARPTSRPPIAAASSRRARCRRRSSAPSSGAGTRSGSPGRCGSRGGSACSRRASSAGARVASIPSRPTVIAAARERARTARDRADRRRGCGARRLTAAIAARRLGLEAVVYEQAADARPRRRRHRHPEQRPARARGPRTCCRGSRRAWRRRATFVDRGARRPALRDARLRRAPRPVPTLRRSCCARTCSSTCCARAERDGVRIELRAPVHRRRRARARRSCSASPTAAPPSASVVLGRRRRALGGAAQRAASRGVPRADRVGRAARRRVDRPTRRRDWRGRSGSTTAVSSASRRCRRVAPISIARRRPDGGHDDRASASGPWIDGWRAVSPGGGTRSSTPSATGRR